MESKAEDREFEREQTGVLAERLQEERRFIQVVSGPRQVGKTTLVRRVLGRLDGPCHYVSADEPALRDATWLRTQWEQAREVEKKSEDFYRAKAGEVDDKNQAHILNRIADEEHKHWVTIENVIKFLDRPRHWLEDAEWNNLEDY